MMRARATIHPRLMNRLEEKYARYLHDRLITGEIRWYLYEAWKFRLADNTSYTPDFIVVDNALRIEAHEVKAQWRTGKPGWKDDSRVKIKVAAEMHPVRFIAATLTQKGSWEFEEFLRDREVKASIIIRADVEAEMKSMKFDTAEDEKRAMDLVAYALGPEGSHDQ